MSLKDDPLIQDIKHRINKAMTVIAESVAGGGASSYEDYKKQCGKRSGLKMALSLIDESIDKYVNDDE